MVDKDTQLTGAQISERAAEVKRQVMNIINDIQLRKWAVEQAVKLAEGRDVTNNEMVEDIVKFFYNFSTQKEMGDEKGA